VDFWFNLPALVSALNKVAAGLQNSSVRYYDELTKKNNFMKRTVRPSVLFLKTNEQILIKPGKIYLTV
jgi:hypothetical protein